MHQSRAAVQKYAEDVLDGRIVAGRWIYAAAKRFLRDLERSDVRMDWDELARLDGFFRSIGLVGAATGKPFELHPWQLFTLANLWCWRWADTGTRRTMMAVVQIGRGNGKTTLMAGLALYDLLSSPGRRVYAMANTERQAMLLVDTARTMANGLERENIDVLHSSIELKGADSTLSALPNKAASMDGLNPSMWIADEAAEFRSREALVKLTTTGAKRSEQLGVIISTPGTSTDSVYGEWVARCEAILKGEADDDTLQGILYGIDPNDAAEDEGCWVKANPAMPHGTPDIRQLRRFWASSKTTAAGRGEFTRYHCARVSEEGESWLDMALYPAFEPIDWEALRGRTAYAGLDLSKSNDMSALCVAVPLDDGTVAVRGEYFYPAGEIRARELEYRLPFRKWAEDGWLRLSADREVDYEAIRARAGELKKEFTLREIAYDPWGSKYLVEQLEFDGVPMASMAMGVRMSPGCILWQNMWLGRKIRIDPRDPIMRRACQTAVVRRDRNGNLILDKSKRTQIIDPLMAAVMAVHLWGGKQASCYEE
jgi:phage terminase large subunit-like protein